MIKRITMWRLKDLAQERSKSDNRTRLKAMLEQLPGQLSEIKHFKVALNVSADPSAADVVLIAFFADRQAYELVLNHPEFRKIMDFVEGIKDDQWFVEYEE
ncbi:MAG: Dabb family protein [Desulfobulbaceae bacterium]|nr:Dabb family protein [Desulfobulbaceae bacterium]